MSSHHSPPPGIGHNSEQPSALRIAAWKRVIARKPKVSPTVARLRMARAEELGMSYADYASVRNMAGRDPAALVFSPAALDLGLGRRLSIDPRTAARLEAVRRCHLLCLSPSEEDPDAFAEELSEITRARFSSAAPMPETNAGWRRLKSIARALLDPLTLTGSTTLMIGDGSAERALCAAGRMADCLSALRYFPHQCEGAHP